MRKCFTSKKTVFNQTTLGPQSTKDWFSTSPNKNEVPENHVAEKNRGLAKIACVSRMWQICEKGDRFHSTWGWNYAVHCFNVSQLAAERWHENKMKRPKKNDKQWNMCFVQFCCHQDRNIADKVCTRKTITDFSAIINVGRLHKSCKETCHSIFSEKNCKYWQGIYSNFGILYSSWLWAARS